MHILRQLVSPSFIADRPLTVRFTELNMYRFISCMFTSKHTRSQSHAKSYSINVIQP